MRRINKILLQGIFAMQLSLMALASCPVYAEDTLSNEKMQSLGINTANVKDQLYGSFAMTSIQSAYATYYTRFFVLTSDTLYVIAPDNRGIELALPLSTIQSAAIGAAGLFSTGRNIELITDLAAVVVNSGNIPAAEKLFADITADGIKVAKIMGERTMKMDGRYVVRTY